MLQSVIENVSVFSIVPDTIFENLWIDYQMSVVWGYSAVMKLKVLCLIGTFHDNLQVWVRGWFCRTGGSWSFIRNDKPDPTGQSVIKEKCTRVIFFGKRSFNEIPWDQRTILLTIKTSGSQCSHLYSKERTEICSWPCWVWPGGAVRVTGEVRLSPTSTNPPVVSGISPPTPPA